ncbi:hypothetical protein HP550_20320 [Cellulomonas humilata]|uniref:Uncharacterized protein n=1 Tax=Cellulomonas humilata TaxID=144055 RepID=A0A7Y6DYG5_9CELL|nr:hypothetical protein [Cellulomonas humilata]NUU19596.1 hypothetical protein [Cellulomonas humilata]
MSAAGQGTGAVPQARVESVAGALLALLPAHLRTTDLAAGGALHALVEVLAGSLAEVDAHLQELYDAAFAETAGEAGLEAIARLVGASPLRPPPGAAGGWQRAYVANTVRYRRGKGTARVIEALAGDVTGLPAVAVEYYQRLVRTSHLLDVRPDRPGTAMLVPGETAMRAGGAFDLLPRLLDVRPVGTARRGRPAGRHGIEAVGVHVLRPAVTHYPAPTHDPVPAAALAAVPPARPWVIGGVTHAGYFQLAAQPGAVLRMFAADRRADADGRRLGWPDLPDRLQRLPLHLETDELRRAGLEGRDPRLGDRPWFDTAGHPFTVFLRRDGDAGFTRVPAAEVRIVNLEKPPSPPGARPAGAVTSTWYEPGPTPHTEAHTVTVAVDPVTGRVLTPEPPNNVAEVAEIRVAHAVGRGRAIGAGPQDRNDDGHPFEIRDGAGARDLLWVVDATAPAGGSAESGGRVVGSLASALTEAAASAAGRRALVLLVRCDRETASAPGATIDVTVPPESHLHLVAAQWRRPRVLPGVPGDPDLRGFVVRRERRFTLDAPVRVVRGTGGAGLRPGRLVLDGLELTGGLTVGTESLAELELRHVTVRSPGAVAVAVKGPATGIHLLVDSAIVGPVATTGTAVTGRLTVTDSVVTADGAALPALAAADLDLVLCNVTVLGATSARSLEATSTVFAEPVKVTRRQSGCVRYSSVPDGSSTPRTFRCQPALALAAASSGPTGRLSKTEAELVRLSVRPVFMDVSADEPTLAMLHPLCPDAIRSGGQDDAEMGAFARAAFGVAVDNVSSLFPEYLPFALAARVLDDTRSGSVASRRNRP